MKGFCLEVSGPCACFTRPEMKVERVSYDVITPSAARAIFDAILWKPAIIWWVKIIEVLAPIRWISVRRNELGKIMTSKEGLFIDETNDEGKLLNRQQRAGLLLRDVKYRLYAQFEFIPPEKRGQTFNPVPDYLVDAEEAEELKRPDFKPDETEAKYAAMFERRANKGQCFHQPYLGCREFAAHVRLIDPHGEPASPISETRDFGWMLYDLDYADPADPKPLFFRPKMKEGVIRVPDCNNFEEVRR
jgi:CRISPR-associated protein Cas5d